MQSKVSILARIIVIALSMCARSFAADSEPVPVKLPGVENSFDLGGGIYSGGSPVGDAGFSALAKLGVKTIVSVDGAKPDVEAARRNGIRYVHLPVGYDGINAERAIELARVADQFREPLFVHCHHGLHRGPAAAALICRVRNQWDAARSIAWLRKAGTSDDYAGLYRSVREFRVPDAVSLAKAQREFRESAPTPVVVDAMVEIDDVFDEIKAARGAGWNRPAGDPGRMPAESAALLREHFRELARLDGNPARPAGYLALLTESEQAAEGLHRALAAGSADEKEKAFKSVGVLCARCHKEHRNTRSEGAEEQAALVMDQRAPLSLEVLTFNIRYPNLADGANYWGLRVKFVTDTILAKAPDIVGLQEAKRGQLDDMKPLLNGYAEIGVGRDDGKAAGEYSAILYKTGTLDVMESGTFWLSDTPEVPGSHSWGNTIPRICTWAKFRHRATGRAFFHFNAHWDHISDASRRKSAELIVRRMAVHGKAGDPLILTGDFNCGEKDAALAPIREAGMLDTFRVLHSNEPDALTFHGWKGGTKGEKIDYVWVTPGVRVIEAEIIRTQREGRFPSDHYPVRAKVALTPGTGPH